MAVPVWLVGLDMLTQAAAAALYIAVGRKVAQRAVSPSARAASMSFALWWHILGWVAAIGSAAGLLTLAGGWTVPILLTFLVVVLLVIVVALAALLYFLIFLYTGRQGAWRWVALFYGALYVFLIYLVMWAEPIGMKEGLLAPQLAFARDLEENPFSRLLGALFTLPILGGAVAYATLYFRDRDPTVRYRVGLTSVSLLVWFGFSLVSGLVGDGNRSLALVAASRLIGVLGASGVFLAYHPPGWVRRRWHVGAAPA